MVDEDFVKTSREKEILKELKKQGKEVKNILTAMDRRIASLNREIDLMPNLRTNSEEQIVQIVSDFIMLRDKFRELGDRLDNVA